MEMGKVIDDLYTSEINCSLTTFWVRIGDEMNGFNAEKECKSAAEAAAFLDQAARKYYPESAYAGEGRMGAALRGTKAPAFYELEGSRVNRDARHIAFGE